MIVVDYLQLMRTHGKRETRTLEISEITRSLKAIAKEMQCPLVALSQHPARSRPTRAGPTA